jgi:hypothetical protein
VQGYNVQVGVTADQLIVATQVSQHTNDSEDFISMMAAVQEAAGLFQAAGRDEAVVGVLLADAGYATDTNLSAPGPNRLIALGSRRNQHRAAAHKPTQGPLASRPKTLTSATQQAAGSVDPGSFGSQGHSATPSARQVQPQIGFHRLASWRLRRAADPSAW